MTKEEYRAYQRRYYLEHREEMLERSKAYKRKNREAWNAYMDRWRKEHPEKHKEIVRRYKENHKEELKAKRHEYYLKTKNKSSMSSSGEQDHAKPEQT